MTSRNLFREQYRVKISIHNSEQQNQHFHLRAIAGAIDVIFASFVTSRASQNRYSRRNGANQAESIVAKNYHTNGVNYPSKLVGHAVYLSSRDIAIAHRRSLIHFGRDARRESITFLQMRGRKVVQICGVYESSSFRTFRAFLEYILPAGGSSAINITRDSNPLPNQVEGGKDDGGGSGERVIVFPVSRFSVLHPFMVFLPVSCFSTVVLLHLIFISIHLGEVGLHILLKAVKMSNLSLLALKIQTIKNR